ncbi:MAG: primosomal protein N' [Candidatus Melainabacteria bacterium]|nr:primosomal protein N' [Candidatus Melainabacteria bacterium]
MTFQQTSPTATLPHPWRTQTPLATVLILQEGHALAEQTFTYRVPEALQHRVQVGCLVWVPLGRQPRLPALVIDCPASLAEANLPASVTLKPIQRLLQPQPAITPAYLDALRAIAQYYGSPLAQVVLCALPSVLLDPAPLQVAVQPDFQAYLSTGVAGNSLVLPQQTPLGQAVVKALQTQKKPVRVSTLASRMQQPAAEVLETLYAMEALGWVLLQRVPLKNRALTAPQQEVEAAVVPLREKNASVGLSSAQQQAVDQLSEVQAQGRTFQLYGVTGSGKTEVYMALTEKMLNAGRSVLMLVPEIALTAPMTQRFLSRFGTEQAALWHSQLSDGERQDAWWGVLEGRYRLVIGARSAIFMPLTNLGLIIIDESHDPSYKQDTPAPRYDARTLARLLSGLRRDTTVVMGSATPDVSDFFHLSQQPGRVIHLPERFGGRPMANVSLLPARARPTHTAGEESIRPQGAVAPEAPKPPAADPMEPSSFALRQQLQGSGLTVQLVQHLQHTIDEGQQAIVLINRRGFHTLVRCDDCGHLFECPHCSVRVTVHRALGKVRCHHCGYQAAIPTFCRQCASHRVQMQGTGTQRVEELLAAALPEARILRLDSDLTQRKHAHSQTLRQFQAGEADVLVGTQMVAKGLDIPNVTLVGVVDGDLGLSLPDFTGAERTFQLLTQVAGRAGRGEQPGEVLLQTDLPDHPVVQLAQQQDFMGFYHYELEQRRKHGFPPFCQLFRLIVTGESEAAVVSFAQAAVGHLRQQLKTTGVEPQVDILGPAACLIAKVRDRFRYHFLVKSRAGKLGHSVVTQFFRQAQASKLPGGLHFLLDVDCLSLL